MSERKLVRRSVALTLGITCIILGVCLVGALAYYMPQVNDKNNTISSLNSQIIALQNLDNQLASFNSSITSDNITIAYLETQIATLQNQINNLQNQSSSSTEQMTLGTPYGMANSGNTVNITAENSGGYTWSIVQVRVNNTVCAFVWSWLNGTVGGNYNAGPVPPLSIVTLKITTPFNFYSGYPYTFVIVSANNHEYQTNGTCPLTDNGEQMQIGSPYGMVNGGNTVNITCSNPSGNAWSIVQVRANNTVCTYLWSWSNGTTGTGTNAGPVFPQNSVTLKITTPFNFYSGYAYTFVVVSATNNEYETTGMCP